MILNHLRGGGYNEIVICDGKAGEEVRIHAQKDMNTTVTGGNQTNRVKTGYQTNTVKGDMKTVVQSGHQTNTVESGTLTETVKGNISVESQTGEVKIKAATKIILEVGGSTVTITPNNIEIKSQRIESNATGQNMVFGNPVDINP